MNQLRVLIVDDEKNIRLTLGTCLGSAGYLTDYAENGEEAIEKTDTGAYDLVFLDMKMPGMNGIEVLKCLKENHFGMNVIMMTAYGTIETAVEAMKLGAVDYLRKPFSPDEVRELADSIVKRQAMTSPAVQDYSSVVEYAKALIVKQDFKTAKEYLQKAVAVDTTKPMAFNLLGVMYEMDSDLQLAQKMYRAALSVDPSYPPALENLHRSVEWHYTKEGMKM